MNTERKSGYFTIGGNYRSKDGLALKVRYLNQPDTSEPSDVGIHEAGHMVGAIVTDGMVVSGTVIPGEGYSGKTILIKPNAIAALVPHADGMSGTGYDVSTVRAGFSSALSEARSIAIHKRPHIKNVARALDRHGTLGGSEAARLVKETDDEEQHGREVLIEVDGPGGREEKRLRAKGEFVLVEFHAKPEEELEKAV